MKTRLISSMEKVFPLPSLEAPAWNRGTAFGGERLNFQFAYLWENAPAFGEAQVITPLSGVTIRKVDLEPGEYVCPPWGDSRYLTRQPGLFPDILDPVDGPIRLFPGQWRALWVSIDTVGEAPGSYPVTIRLAVNGETAGEETFLFELLPLALPAQTLHYTQWFHGDCIAQQYHIDVFSEKWWELTERYVAFAAEHGINMLLTPLFTPPLDTMPGRERLTVQLVDVYETEEGWDFGYERLDRWLAMCERCGIRYLEASHLFTQWGAAHAPKVMGYRNGRYERLFGWETDAEGEEYQAFLSAFLPDLTRYFRIHSMEGRVYFHISDEPSTEHLGRYERLSARIRSLTPGFLRMDAISDYSFYEKGLMDIPVCATNHIQPFLDHQAPHLWAYYCCAQDKDVSNRFLALSGARNRCIGLQLYMGGVEGFLQWGYNFWMAERSREVIDPRHTSDGCGAYPAGDPFSVYPGPEGPVASVGLELFYEAIQDMRAFTLAEQLVGREAVQKLCREASWCSFSTSTDSAEEVLNLREKINSLCSAKDI